MQEALALWRGPPLDDLANEPFAAPEIRRLEDLWLQAREAAIDTALADGRHVAVIGRARRSRPRPSAARAAARAAACSRSTAAAGRPTRSTRSGTPAQFLLDEVGLEPGPELRTPERRDPPPGLRSSTAPPRAGHRRRARGRRRGGSSRPPSSRSPARCALAFALLAGLGRARPDRRGRGGRDRPRRAGGSSRSTPSATRPTRSRRAPARCGAPTAATAPSRASTAPAAQVTTIDVGGEPTALAFGDGSLWVADGENRPRRPGQLATNRVVDRLPAGNAPRGVAVTSGAVWVSSAVDGQVRAARPRAVGPEPRDRRARRPGGDRRRRGRRVGGE